MKLLDPYEEIVTINGDVNNKYLIYMSVTGCFTIIKYGKTKEEINYNNMIPFQHLVAALLTSSVFHDSAILSNYIIPNINKIKFRNDLVTNKTFATLYYKLLGGKHFYLIEKYQDMLSIYKTESNILMIDTALRRSTKNYSEKNIGGGETHFLTKSFETNGFFSRGFPGVMNCLGFMYITDMLSDMIYLLRYELDEIDKSNGIRKSNESRVDEYIRSMIMLNKSESEVDTISRGKIKIERERLIDENIINIPDTDNEITRKFLQNKEAFSNSSLYKNAFADLLDTKGE
jgi:hypothetical protein